jgi:hypothetical protein
MYDCTISWRVLPGQSTTEGVPAGSCAIPAPVDDSCQPLHIGLPLGPPIRPDLLRVWSAFLLLFTASENEEDWANKTGETEGVVVQGGSNMHRYPGLHGPRQPRAEGVQ